MQTAWFAKGFANAKPNGLTRPRLGRRGSLFRRFAPHKPAANGVSPAKQHRLPAYEADSFYQTRGALSTDFPGAVRTDGGAHIAEKGARTVYPHNY